MSRRVKAAFVALVVLGSLRYWVGARIHHPEEPLSVQALAKAGDIEYYPMIAALSRGELGESMAFEKAGEGVGSFPIASLIPHAVTVALFGTAGFVVADVVVYLIFYSSLLWLFTVARVSSPWRECLSLLIICGGAEAQYHIVHSLSPALWESLTSWDLTFWVWGDRVPRPFVSEVFLVLTLAAVIRLVHSTRALVQPRYWLAAGIALAALLQGDLHGTIIMGFVLAAVSLYAAWRLRDRPVELIRGGLILAGSALMCSSWFWVQRLAEHSDLPGRFGVFPIGRLDTQFLAVYPLRRLAPIFALLLVAAVAAMQERRTTRVLRLRLVSLFAVINVIACYALPLSALVLGKGIQLYHFTDRFMHVRAYTALIAFAWIVSGFARWTTSSRAADRQPGAGWVRRAAIGLTSAVAILWFTSGVIAMSAPVDRWANGPRFRALQRDRSQHMRAATFSDWAVLPHYHEDFVALTTELSTPRYVQSRVIGTFDLQVFSWWTTFGGGYSFVPEAFLSTVSDAEIEARLIRFCRLLQIDRAGFQQLLARRYVEVFWLGSDKYQASAAYMFSKPDDYTAEVRRDSSRTTVYSSWNLALPLSEQHRLTANFQDTDFDSESLPRLDLIVLIKGLEDFQPPAREFVQTFENPTFRVWLRVPRLTNAQSNVGPPR